MPLSHQQELLIEGKLTERWADSGGRPVEFHMAYLTGLMCPSGVVVALIAETASGTEDHMVCVYQAPNWSHCLYWGNDINEAHQTVWKYVEPRLGFFMEDPDQLSVKGALGLHDQDKTCRDMGAQSGIPPSHP